MRKIILASIVALATGTASMAAINTASCKGCHGQNFEKKALNVSRVVKDLTAAQIEEALKGYKVGKGGPMKGIMKDKIAKYSDADIEAFAKSVGKK